MAVYIGERAADTADASGTVTNSFPLTSSCSSGNTVILLFACRDTSTAGAVVTDARGNTWTVDVGPVGFANSVVFIASTRQNGGTLLSGDTISVAFTTAPSLNVTWLVEEFSGVAASNYVDQTATGGSASGVSSGSTGTTAALSQSSELAIAAWCVNSITSFTKDSGYSAFTTTAVLPAGRKALGGCYLILSSNGAQIASSSWAPSASFASAIVTYKTSADITITSVPAVATASSVAPTVPFMALPAVATTSTVVPAFTVSFAVIPAMATAGGVLLVTPNAGLQQSANVRVANAWVQSRAVARNGGVWR